jgi:N-sulfoglucosamine sulfohydrolase
MKEAAKTDADIAARVKHIEYRVREELYDLKQDPFCLHNLVDDPQQAAVKAELKKIMHEEMVKTEDPLLPSFLGEGTIPPLWLKANKAAATN